jgi:uncharacterized protein
MTARLPRTAAWRHLEAKEGFEALVIDERPAGGWRFAGATAAVEEGEVWAVSYEIQVDDGWCTRRASVSTRSAGGERTVEIESDGKGNWWADGAAVLPVSGCLDLDLESSAFTNALPVQRMRLDIGARAEAPAAYVRATDLRIERLEQRYARLADRDGGEVYDYESPAFEFRCELAYDDSGLVREYPGIATRAA